MKNPFSVNLPGRKNFTTMKTALKDGLKKPYIGVTQGGSSRRDAGCRVAATIAEVKPSKRKEL